MVQKVAVAQKKLEIVSEIEAIQLPAELVNHPVLQGLSQKVLAKAAKLFDLVRVPRGANLYTAGHAAKAVYFVVSGAVRSYHSNAQGETIESHWSTGFSLLGAGEALARAEEMMESAQAAEPVVAFSLPMATFQEMFQADGGLLANVARALAERHVRAIANERAALAPAFVRVANHLSTLALRTGKMVAPELYLIATTQEDVASASGLNPRTISRALKVLQQKGRVYIRRGEYLLRQPETLAEAFSPEEIASA